MIRIELEAIKKNLFETHYACNEILPRRHAIKLRVIPCQINAKNGQPHQISTKLGLQVELNDLLAHSKFWPPKLCGFYFTALRKLDFSCIFAIPDHTKQTVFSFLLHLHRHFLYKSVAYEKFSNVVEQD